ncbi:hypothetical protein Ocin01_02517 [Orchesella cincta]|uniref:Uncharacterized protein n=1 Tax=Orchesella cincta TaxID=48709 RepID=A0A1D2NG24_ORCCI|nr:hypothetical protein Ocin01_02517 [Orchesella cincta]
MSVNAWLRLGLPLGNTLLLIAIYETVDHLRYGLKDIGIFLYQAFALRNADYTEFYSASELIFLTVTLAIKLNALVGLLWIGTILKGNKTAFLSWIVITLLTTLALAIFMIINVVKVNVHYHLEPIYNWSLVYSIIDFLLINAYTLFIFVICYKALCRQEALQPIGRGIVYIWEYFNNETKIAATFFLASELVLDSEYLISRQFIQLFGTNLQGHEGERYPPIVTEEIVLRLIRIVVNAVGVWLVVTEKRRLFRYWCALTFALILVSTSIFIILTVLWRGEDISVTLVYFLMFPGHLLYRFLTLYFCLRYTRVDFSSFVL